MDRVSDVLSAVLRKRGLRKHATAAHVTFAAREWLQKQSPILRDTVTVQSLKDGTLQLQCTHPIALQEMQAALPEFTASLQKAFPSLLKHVRITRA